MMNDAGLDFAHKLLRQIRIDLKKFAPRQQKEACAAIGRHRKYLERMTPERLRLHEAFAVIRFLGFHPAEYVERLSAGRPVISPGVPGFMGRHRRQPSDDDSRIRLRYLAAFLKWARDVPVDENEPSRLLDLEERLTSFGLNPLDRSRADIVLSYADQALKVCVFEQFPAVSPESARGLIRTVLLLERVLPRDLPHLRAMAALVDLGFRLELFIEDLSLRLELFIAGSRVSEDLGFPHDAVWLMSKASELAAWTYDFSRSQELQRRINDVLAARRLAGIRQPVAAKGPSVASRDDLLGQGRMDQQQVLAAMLSDRANAPESAKRLDGLLGRSGAFYEGITGVRPVHVHRWVELAGRVGASPEFILSRLTPFLTTPVPSGRLLPALKVAGSHQPKYSWQPVLLAWSDSIVITDRAERLKPPPEEIRMAHEPGPFETVIVYLEKLLEECPDELCAQDAQWLGISLVRASLALSRFSWLDDGVDFLESGLRVLDKLPVFPEKAFAFRTASRLAQDLGELHLTSVFLGRARQVDLHEGCIAGLTLTAYAEGIMEGLSDRHERARALFQYCLGAIERVSDLKDILPLGAVHLALGTTWLRLGNERRAKNLVDQAEQELRPLSATDRADLFLIKAEVLSKLGLFQEPLDLLGQASAGLDPEKHPRELALLGLRRSMHLLDFGRFAEAQQEAIRLTALATRLERNPIGRHALTKVVQLAWKGQLQLSTVDGAEKRVRNPNLFKGWARTR